MELILDVKKSLSTKCHTVTAEQIELIRKEAVRDTLASLVRDGLLPVENAVAFAGITEAEVEEERMQLL